MNKIVAVLLSLMVFTIGVSTVNASEPKTPEQTISTLISAMEANDAETIGCDLYMI